MSAYALHVRDRGGRSRRGEGRGAVPLRSRPCRSTRSRGCGRSSTTPRSTARSRGRSRIGRTRRPAPRRSPPGYDDGAHLVLASDRRTDGIVLDALITDAARQRPHSEGGRRAHRQPGQGPLGQHPGERLHPRRAAPLLREVRSADRPSFVARAWLGDTYAAEHSFQGRSIDREHTLVPMSDAEGQSRASCCRRTGPAASTTASGFEYAPSDLHARRARRRLRRRPRVRSGRTTPATSAATADGVWHIKPGAMVRVRADDGGRHQPHQHGARRLAPGRTRTAQPGARRVAAAAAREADVDDPQARTLPMWYGATWFDHENLRDDRVEAFSAYLYGGTYDYTYVARGDDARRVRRAARPKPRRSTHPRCSAARPAIASSSADPHLGRPRSSITMFVLTHGSHGHDRGSVPLCWADRRNGRR